MENQRLHQTVGGSIRRRPKVLPSAVISVQAGIEPVGLHLICTACRFYIPTSREIYTICHNYKSDGPPGSPLTRRYVRCPNCTDELVLGRNIGDADNLVAIAGATVSEDDDPNRNANLENEVYEDRIHEMVCKTIKEPGRRIKYYSQVLGRCLPAGRRN